MTLQELKNERLKRYVEAEQVVLTGQSYTLGDRTLTRANLSEIRDAIDDLLDDGATLDDEGIVNKRRWTRRVTFYD